MHWFKHHQRWVVFALTIGFILAAALLVPPEKTLGSSLGLILSHGAWVWTGMIAFGLSAAAGLLALIMGKILWHAWSRSLGYTGMFFWLTYLPMSLLVMQLTWGGLFLDEPRWKVPFTFAVVGALLQLGLYLLNRPVFTSAANLIFGAALWVSLRSTSNILHPDSPVSDSGSAAIQFFFWVLMILTLLLAAQVAAWFHSLLRKNTG